MHNQVKVMSVQSYSLAGANVYHHLIHQSLGPRVSSPNGILTGSVVFADITVVPNTVTHRETTASSTYYTHPFNGPFSGTTQVRRYQKGKTNLDFTEARDSEWLWHQLGHMQVCTSLQTDKHASTPPLSFLQAGCPSCHPTNSVKAVKAQAPKAHR